LYWGVSDWFLQAFPLGHWTNVARFCLPVAEAMGAEVGCLEPDALGVGLNDLAHALIREPLCAEPAAFGDGPE
jgi:hypothetical protein